MKLVKLLMAVCMLTFAAFAFTGCGDSNNNATKEPEKAKEVRIGTMNLVNGDLIAQYEKWYENELGIPVKIVKFDSGKDVNSAIAAGAIDIGELGTSPAALAISNNLDIEVFWVGDIIGAAETLVAKNSSNINSVSDLVGKKVGAPFASTAHYSLLNALKLEGVDENSVKLLDLQPDDIYAAWQRNDIDAAYVWYPVLGELLKDGKSITDSEKLAQRGVVTGDATVVMASFAKANPEIVKKFVEIQIKANEMINNDKAKAAKEVAAVLQISEEDAAEQLTQFKYLTPEEQIDFLDNQMAQTLKSTSDFLVEQKSIKSAPDLESFKGRVTSEFVKSAIQK
ncbi:MAG: ABC transporter substrate-binding protein [Selenomonadaceae bacterium]|nr:ABC transporter substrate-binding protein [Selenomonadaceae bacterium]